ncbi:DUF3549 family protein [Shewanella olleyana]|uniref:DUF3549 family protein n=1 Tax=Shewanella olleyana TaxID=135626 RepID=UPI00200CEC46|nr:DUF3549 family protein [Shewanella olleyana]MCL1067091.1 DUF3549 family protein [Shewanella olleyana]
MTQLETLSQFLDTANTQFQVYDLGRRVENIDPVLFNQIEALNTPYPFPIQGHAQFAIVFWREDEIPFIWFLKLPLDEQGLLSPAQRSQFIKMILEALGRDPTKALSDEEQERYANHPFSFKPSQEKLALFNALVKKQLSQQASAQYEYAAQYFANLNEKNAQDDSWQQLGLQGIADVCVRLDKFDHDKHINTAMKLAPLEVQAAICQCLEHVTVSNTLAETLYDNLSSAEVEHKHIYLRALASQPELTQKAIQQLVNLQQLDENLLITIAARSWTALKDDATRKLYLEVLANQPQNFFNQVFADIVAIPSLRNSLLLDLRSADRSEKLSSAIGGLFRAVSQ